jgi:predicted  nucleic acid-binding Zn-ribbon protein
MSFGLEPLYKQITDLEKQLKDAQKEIESEQNYKRMALSALEKKRELVDEAIDKVSELEAKIEAADKQINEIKLEAILASMMAIYEGSADWNKGYKAGAADMVIKIQKELLPILEIPQKEP